MPYWTRASLQRESGRSRAEVDRLIAIGLPHEQVGRGRGGEIRVPREKALNWLTGFVLDAKAEPGSSPELTRERTRLAKEQADKTALENALARKELLPAAEVARADEIIMAGLRDRIMAVQSVAPLLSDAALKEGGIDEVRSILRQSLQDALEEVGTAELVSLQERVAEGDGAAA